MLKSFAFIITAEIYLTYLVVVKPFYDKDRLKDDLFNQGCNICIVTCLLLFTKFVPEAT